MKKNQISWVFWKINIRPFYKPYDYKFKNINFKYKY